MLEQLEECQTEVQWEHSDKHFHRSSVPEDNLGVVVVLRVPLVADNWRFGTEVAHLHRPSLDTVAVAVVESWEKIEDSAGSAEDRTGWASSVLDASDSDCSSLAAAAVRLLLLDSDRVVDLDRR